MRCVVMTLQFKCLEAKLLALKSHGSLSRRKLTNIKHASLSFVLVCTISACGTTAPKNQIQSGTGNLDDLLVIDCLLPGQVRQLGSRLTYLSPRRPIKTSATTCEIRGGEYVSFDRADAGTSLKIWVPQAQNGDPEAQTYVGEIFEKGLGVDPDFEVAAHWYQQAASQGYTRAQINLGYLYESGLGVSQDLTKAMNFYRQASGIDSGSLEYVSTVEFAKRESAKRNTENLRVRVSDLEERLVVSEAQFRSLKQQSKADEAEFKKLSEQIAAKRQEIVNEFQASSSQADGKTSSVLFELESIREQLSVAATRNDNLDEQLAQSRTEILSLKDGLVDDSERVEALKSRLSEQFRIIATLKAEAENAASSPELEKTQSKLNTVLASAASTKDEVNALRQQDNLSTSDSLIASLANAEDRELELVSQLAARTSSIANLRRQQVQLEKQYKQSISTLQSELELSQSEQSRVSGRLADTELSLNAVESENQELRERLREQNAEVAAREQEQQRLSARVAALSISEQVSQAEKRAAEASTRVVDAELALARFEQSRLVTKLVQAELDLAEGNQSNAVQLAILEKELAIQTGVVENRQQQIEALEGSVTEDIAGTRTFSSEEVAQVVAIGPTIEIIEPPVLLTRGPGQITTQNDGTIDLVGRVGPADDLVTFTVNGQRQDFNRSGVFSFKSSEKNIDALELTAVDGTGARASVSFSVAKRSSGEAQIVKLDSSSPKEEKFNDIDFGSYHAIVIGNNEYEELSDLRTAEADAVMIDQLLREQYGFSTQLLVNATKSDILIALSKAREELTDKDNLMIYYAGHGQIDPDGERGFWLPVDAGVNDKSNWISNAVVTNFLDSIPAKQIMIVADSCFSGTLTQASIPRTQAEMPTDLRKKWLSLMSKRKVRTVLSSGGVKPVYDGVGDHSVFATAFIDQLANNRGVLEGHRLYSTVRQDVQVSADQLGVDQIPQYAAVKYAGHEVGEFLFVNSSAL